VGYDNRPTFRGKNARSSAGLVLEAGFIGDERLTPGYRKARANRFGCRRQRGRPIGVEYVQRWESPSWRRRKHKSFFDGRGVRHAQLADAFRDRARRSPGPVRHPSSFADLPACGQRNTADICKITTRLSGRCRRKGPFGYFRLMKTQGIKYKADPQCHPVLRPLAPALFASTGSE